MPIDDFPRRSVAVMHPLRAMLVPAPFICFVGALATDLAYWRSTNVEWETFSIWLLTAGLVGAGVAILAALVDFLGRGRRRGLLPSWSHALGYALALALALVNAFVHSRDGYTAVVPTGLLLSGLVVLILMLTNWTGWSLSYRTHSEVPN